MLVKVLVWEVTQVNFLNAGENDRLKYKHTEFNWRKFT